MKTYKLHSILFLVLFARFASAQVIMPLFPKCEDFSDIKGSKIIVGLMDTTDKKQNFPRFYNNNIMRAVKAELKFCNYEFGNISDFVDMKKAKEDVYLLIPVDIDHINLSADFLKRERFSAIISYLQIGKASDLKIKKKLLKNYNLVFNKYKLTAVCGSYDLISMVTSIHEMDEKVKYTCATKEEKKEINGGMRDATILRTKTLLFDKDMLPKDMTEAKLTEIYKYPFKIVDVKEIEQAILNKESDKAFIHTEPISDSKAMDGVFVKPCDNLTYAVVIVQGRGDGNEIGERKLKEINELVSREKKKK